MAQPLCLAFVVLGPFFSTNKIEQNTKKKKEEEEEQEQEEEEEKKESLEQHGG